MTKDNRPSHRQLGVRCDHWLEVLDELNIGAFVADSRRQIMAINLSAQALLGLREPEVIDRDCREVFTGVPCTVACVLDHPEGTSDNSPDMEVTDEENQRHLITRMATPIYHPLGEVVGCMTILQDHSPITQLIDRLHYEERRLKIILDNLDVGIFTVNRGGLINFFNCAAETISGYDRHQVLGQSCARIFSGEKAKDVCLLKNSMATGKARMNRKGHMTDRDGVTIPIRATYMALKNEKNIIVGGLATFHDMTLAHQLNRAISNRYTFHDMIGKEPAMQKVFEMVSVVAPSDATVLVEGATGTGKDLLAKVIHSASTRTTGAFVKVNCAAIPENLIESEIFGYVKGAFTGADRDKPGRFADAEGGTIFLDEIGDLPLLIRHIARSLCAARGVTPPAISKAAMQVLLNYDYPGNVRELENILEHALIICREAVIHPDHLPDYVRQGKSARQKPPAQIVPATSPTPEHQLILDALEKTGGHRLKAARELGMERTTLWRKMKKYGIG